MTWLALDIGGANIKIADGRGYSASEPFALWREPARLSEVLRFTISRAPRCDCIVATMTGELAGFASIVDARDYTRPGQQSLTFTGTALRALLAATAEQGVDPRVLAPVHDLVRRQIDAGFGAHGTARIFEGLVNR